VNKIPGCVITDCGYPGLHANCVESFYIITEDICNHNTYIKYVSKHNVFFVNATENSLKVIDHLKELNKKVVVVLECSGAFKRHNYLDDFYHSMINKADLVLCQFGRQYMDIVKSYFDVPFEFFGVPADIHYINESVSNVIQERIKIHVWCLEKTEDFNSQTNFYICRKIQERFPSCKIVCPRISSIYRKYLNNVDETGGLDQVGYWRLLKSCSVSINMSDRITWGRHFIECCAVKTPCFSSYCGVADLCSIPYYHEYDVESTVENIIKALSDESYYNHMVNMQYSRIQKVSPEDRFTELKRVFHNYEINQKKV
jgi:hypothetical protein